MPLEAIGESRKSEWLLCDFQGDFFKKGDKLSSNHSKSVLVN